MKIKIVLIFAFVLTSVISFSQNDSISRFPASKNFMLEIDFNPFGNDGVFSFDHLQTKYWISNKTALRLGVRFDYKSNTQTENDYEASEIIKPTFSENSLLIGFKPGIEFRILEKSKISPYWGVELSYINKSSNSEYVDYDRVLDYDIGDYVYQRVERNLSGAWREIETGYYQFPNGFFAYQNTSYQNERAFNSFGTNVFMGADYYFMKNMYLGFEIGLGYEMLMFKQIELEVINPIEFQPWLYDLPVSTYPSSKSANFGFYYNNSIRLGIYF